MQDDIFKDEQETIIFANEPETESVVADSDEDEDIKEQEEQKLNHENTGLLQKQIKELEEMYDNFAKNMQTRKQFSETYKKTLIDMYSAKSQLAQKKEQLLKLISKNVRLEKTIKNNELLEEQKNITLNAEISFIDAKLCETKLENEELKTKIHSLEEDIAQHKIEMEEIKQQLAKLESHNKQLQEDNNTKTSKIAELDDQIKQMSEQIDNYDEQKHIDMQKILSEH